MPTSTGSRSGESSDVAPTDWIKNNMFGDIYSVDLGRSLTDAEIRFQKCLEQLPVPSWYLTYSKKKPSIRQNCIPFDKRPPTWKQVKAQVVNQRKSPKKRSPKSSPKNSDSESRADSGFNETYRISRRTPRKNKSPCISITSSSSDDEPDTPTLTEKEKSLTANLSLNRTPRQPFPPHDGELELEPKSIVPKPRTVYTKTKNMEVWPCDSSTSSAPPEETHTTFLIADIDPGGVFTRIQVSAGIATQSLTSSFSSSDEDASKLAQPSLPTPQPRLLPSRCSPSPHTRFFNSRQKSTALEGIVRRKLGKPRGNLVQDIVDELEQSTASASADDFVRSMVSALEESIAGDVGECREDEADGDLESGSDSELSKSVDISIKSSGGEESADDQPTSTPLPRVPSSPEASEPTSESSAESEEEVYWIPTWLSKLPRTSSRLSVLSRASGRSSLQGGTGGRSSPSLSPIRRECPEDWFINSSRAWGYTYSSRKNRSPRSLFRIDETGHLDSGYSDTASSRRTAPSRTATIGSARRHPSRTTMYGSFSLSSRSKSTTDVFRASTCIDGASYPPANYSTLSRSHSGCSKGSASSSAHNVAHSLALDDQAEQLKRSKSYLTEDIRRQFELGFEASVARKAAGQTPSPRSDKSRVIVKRLVETLERRQKEVVVPPDAGFQKRALKATPLSKDDRYTVPGTKERQHVFQERFHPERVFSRMPSKLEKLREEEVDDFPDSDDDLPSPYNAWGSEPIIPSAQSSLKAAEDNNESPVSSRFSARRTLKNVFSSFKSWRVGGSAAAKSLPKGSRDYYAARESLGEEMRAFRRDTMPRLMEHAEVKVRLPAKQERLRQREQNREFVELINSPRLAPEDAPPSIATIHPVYGSKAAATQSRRSLKLNDALREAEEAKPEVIYKSKRVMSPEAPVTEHLLRPSTIRNLQKRLSDSSDAVRLRPVAASSTTPTVYDVPRSNRPIAAMPPTAPEAYIIRLEPRQRTPLPEYENLSARITDDKRLQCTTFTTF